MEEALTVVLVGLALLVVAIALAGLLVPPIWRLIVGYTRWVMSLPLIVTILAFFFFPPLLLVFLVGIAMLQFEE